MRVTKECAIAVTILVFATTGAPGQPCTSVEPTRLKIVSDPEDTGDKIVWKARDPGEGLLIDDPTAGTTRVELYDGDGRNVLQAVIGPANAAGWTFTGSRWVYRDHDDPAPPDGIVRVVSKAKNFRFRGKGPDLDEIEAPPFPCP